MAFLNDAGLSYLWGRLKELFAKKKHGIYQVIGTQSEGTNAFTGNIDLDALYDGLTIAYYLPYTNPSGNVTLELTLSNNATTGAIPVFQTGTTRLTTHYAAGSTITLTYWSAGSISVNGTPTTAARWTNADYNTNTNTQVRVYRQSSYTGDYPLIVSRTAASAIGTAGTDSSYTGVYGMIPDATAKIPTVDMATGELKATMFTGQINGTASTATTLETPRTIDGLEFDGSANIRHYGVCSTAAGTAAKTVTCDGFVLAEGAWIAVKFVNTNTVDNPTLNVESTGAKAICYRGSAIAKGYLAANRTYIFVYDGTQYEFVGDVNTNTTYSALTNALITTGTDTANRTVSAKVFHDALESRVTSITPSDIGLGNVENKSSADIRGELTQQDVIDALGYTPGSGTGGDPNQNAFSVIKVGNTTISADTVTDTLELIAGSNITLTPNATNDSVTISASASGTAVDPATAAPEAPGIAAVGTSLKYAREDHVHPEQTDISGNASTASTLETSRKIDGVAFDGSSDILHYGSSSTAAGTQAKAVSCNGFSLVTGALIIVKFTVTNTADNPQLNVNSTGAKAIYYRGSAINKGALVANRSYLFAYNGTQFELIGDLDANTTYSAGSGLSLSGTTFRTNMPRITSGSVDDRMPGINTTVHEELSNAVEDLPSAHFYHVISMQGADDYGTQIALGMTTTGAYYRRYGGGVFSDWKALTADYMAGTNAPPTIASTSALGSSARYARQDHTHGIALATGDNNGQVKIAGTNVSVKGLGTAAYTASTTYMPATGGTINATGGTVSGLLTLQQGYRAYATSGASGGGSAGYIRLAIITITGRYANAPIEFWISQRMYSPVHVLLRFNNDSGTDPSVSMFSKYGGSGPEEILIHKETTSTWGLYVKKEETYDSIAIHDVKYSAHMAGVMTIAWDNTYVANAPSNSIVAGINQTFHVGKAGIRISGNLAANATSLTLSSSAIKTSSLIDIYTEVYGAWPGAVTVNNGSIVMSQFTARSSAMAVTVVVQDP